MAISPFQLDYVTFHPWKTFDPHVTRGDYETSLTLEHAVRCDPYYGGSLNASYHTSWEIVWRVGDRVSSPTPHREGYTINESMTEIQIEHAHGRYGDGDLALEFVVKRITESATKTAPKKMAIEIFQMLLFPLKPLKLSPGVMSPTEMSERDLLAHRAYVRDEEIPPLIPA